MYGFVGDELGWHTCPTIVHVLLDQAVWQHMRLKKSVPLDYVSELLLSLLELEFQLLDLVV
jgi:hypothetical protein